MSKRGYVSNAEYYGTPGTGSTLSLKEAFVEWCRRCGNLPNSLHWETVLKFAQAPAKTVLQYREGHLFTVVGLVGDGVEFNGRFATIRSFQTHAMSIDPGEWNCDQVYADIVAPDGSVDSRWLNTENMGKASVPPQILALAKAQLRENCPLKKEGPCLES